VRQLYSGRLGEGTSTLQWDGRDALGNRVPAGLYLARVRAGMHEARTKLVLVN
jgi:flagellar hook assembly protein FlgD